MLNKKTIDSILAGFESNMNKANAERFPEIKKLYKDYEYPSGGQHKHDESNPFGTHRHFTKDSIDGPHTHTPQNPGGEHSHGENKGMALVDGAHTHENSEDYGYHWHDRKEKPPTHVEKPGV